MPPVFFFVIDVSVTAINSGMVATACAAIKESLDSLPGGDRTRIGFLTYDNHLQFYNLKASLSQPQMMVSIPKSVACNSITLIEIWTCYPSQLTSALLSCHLQLSCKFYPYLNVCYFRREIAAQP